MGGSFDNVKTETGWLPVNPNIFLMMLNFSLQKVSVKSSCSNRSQLDALCALKAMAAFCSLGSLRNDETSTKQQTTLENQDIFIVQTQS